MNLLEQIKKDLIEATKNKETEKVSVLRLLLSAIKNREIDLRGADLSDEIILEVLAKQAKQRKDSVAEFEKGRRPELAQAEKNELDIIERYLPEQISDEEIENVVKKTIDELEAVKSDFGKVMGSAVGKMKGRAEGSRIKAAVEKLLQ